MDSSNTPAAPAQVYAIGTIAVDEVEQVDVLPREDSFSLVQNSTRSAGGSAANVAAQLAHLGVKVSFAAALGDDALAGLSRAELEAAGVDCAGFVTRAGMRSCCCRVMVASNGDHCITVNMGDAFFTLPEDASAQVFDQDRADGLPEVFYTDLLPRPAADAALLRAEACGSARVVNLQCGFELYGLLGWTNETLVQAVLHASQVIMCGDALCSLLRLAAQNGDGRPARAQSRTEVEAALVQVQSYLVAQARSRGLAGPDTLIATCGAEGSVACSKDGRVLSVGACSPAEGQCVVDGTGAGDAYAAGFIAAHLLAGWPLERSLVFSSECALNTVCQLGARAPAASCTGLAARLAGTRTLL